jgi:hypothetical protein
MQAMLKQKLISLSTTALTGLAKSFGVLIGKVRITIYLGLVMSQSFKKTGIAADYQKVAEKLYEYLQKNNLYDEYKDLFWERYCRYNSFAFNNLNSQDRSEARRRVQNFLRQHESEVKELDKNVQKTIKKTLFFGQNVPSAIKRAIKKAYYADPTRKKQIREIETLQDAIVDSY